MSTLLEITGECILAGMAMAVMLGVCMVCLQGMAWAWEAICDRIDRTRINLRQKKRRARHENPQPRD